MKHKFNQKIFNRLQELYKAKYSTLSEVYDTYSFKKESAYTDCKSECDRCNGYYFRILSHNAYTFTCGYLYDLVDEETAEVKATYMVIHTAYSRYEYDITDYIEYVHN